MDRLRADRLLAPHFRFYVREVRVVAYTQARAWPALKTIILWQSEATSKPWFLI